jgi:hypothetical protein
MIISGRATNIERYINECQKKIKYHRDNADCSLNYHNILTISSLNPDRISLSKNNIIVAIAAIDNMIAR